MPQMVKKILDLYAAGNGYDKIRLETRFPKSTLLDRMKEFRELGIVTDRGKPYDQEKLDGWLADPENARKLRNFEKFLQDERQDVRQREPGEIDVRQDVSKNVLHEKQSNADPFTKRLTSTDFEVLQEIIGWWKSRLPDQALTHEAQASSQGEGKGHSVTVRIPEALYRDLDAEAKARGVKLSQVIRGRLEQHIKKQE